MNKENEEGRMLTAREPESAAISQKSEQYPTGQKKSEPQL